MKYIIFLRYLWLVFAFVFIFLSEHFDFPVWSMKLFHRMLYAYFSVRLIFEFKKLFQKISKKRHQRDEE